MCLVAFRYFQRETSLLSFFLSLLLFFILSLTNAEVVPPAPRSDSSSIVVALEGCRDLVGESELE